jgi:hypothetical protein
MLPVVAYARSAGRFGQSDHMHDLGVTEFPLILRGAE